MSDTYADFHYLIAVFSFVLQIFKTERKETSDRSNSEVGRTTNVNINTQKIEAFPIDAFDGNRE